MEIGIPHAFRCIPQKTWERTLLKYSGPVKTPKSQFQDTVVLIPKVKFLEVPSLRFKKGFLLPDAGDSCL
jgi:hypothetical protein